MSQELLDACISKLTEAGRTITDLQRRLAEAEAKAAMADAVAAGDGTLHNAIDHWQERALAAEAKLAEAQKDAERWRTARQYLSVEDIEAWWIEMKGHQPSEIENTKADAAIDAAKGGAHA